MFRVKMAYPLDPSVGFPKSDQNLAFRNSGEFVAIAILSWANAGAVRRSKKIGISFRIGLLSAHSANLQGTYDDSQIPDVSRPGNLLLDAQNRPGRPSFLL
jgi:hypothetical protein